MSDKGPRRGAGAGAGAPFYAPPRRKTSAEIISEARAAVYGEMSGAGSAGGAGGALRTLRTRRPYTPREPQRALFQRRDPRYKEKDTRPPSAFDLKYLSLSESSEEALVTMGARVAGLDDDNVQATLTDNTQPAARRKPALRGKTRSVQESGDGWGGFSKLPHLSGRAKPLHRRNTSQVTPEETESELAQSISISYLGNTLSGEVNSHEFKDQSNLQISKSLSPESKRKQFVSTKSQSYDANSKKGLVGDIGVKHLAVQLPNTSSYQLATMSVLEICDALVQRNRDVEQTVLLMDTLQARLESSVPATSLRDLVLRSLYAHIDSEDERVLVAIARAMLTMRVTGNHLAAACKLVFKIARNDKNDHFFRDTNLIELVVEGCGRAEPVSEAECCVYGAGALRVLALEPRLAARALASGAVPLAALHLKLLTAAKADSPRSVSEQCTHAVYQLTGALRNLAGAPRAPAEFLASGALAELVAALLHHTDRDVLTNVARCLSVLSAEERCCEWLGASRAAARALLRALAACAARAPLAVRLAYTLGNMAAAGESARRAIYNEEGGVDVLLTILESYTKRNDHDAKDPDAEAELDLVGTDLGGSDGSNEDVLIKTVRVLANLCLTESAGRGLAAVHSERVMKALLACLDLAERSTQQMKMSPEASAAAVERREELATAALATLNNITFYREPDPPDPLHDSLDRICAATCRWLQRGGAPACEAARALGNLTREPRAAQLFLLEGALDALDTFFDHDEESVRCAAAGVLVNVCGAGAGGGGGEAGGAAARALAAACARGDAPAAALLARALWNAHAHAPLLAARAHTAARALAAFIDDDSVFRACEASRNGHRRASDPSILKHKVTFEPEMGHRVGRTLSVDQDLHLEHISEDEALSGEDLGFEEGDLGGESCDCEPCVRLAAWEELVGVAIPLLEKLRPVKADASVGTD